MPLQAQFEDRQMMSEKDQLRQLERGPLIVAGEMIEATETLIGRDLTWRRDGTA